MNRILILFFTLTTSLTALADQPFRNHRYDALNALPVDSESIVFVGNSITNMHEWWEAFGNPHVLNRGVSGAVSDEMLENLSHILEGKPQKVFLMIGTNDLGTDGLNTATHVAGNLRVALRRFAEESPSTEVFVQSILPSRRRDIALQKETNDSLKDVCRAFGVTYIDLWNDLLSVTENNLRTLDGLHLSASGYKLWCQKIAPLVGSPSVYESHFADNPCGLTYSNGMRATQFSCFPVCWDDILFIGDEMIHSGEWHELLASPHAKSRSIGWGFPGANIRTMDLCLEAIFKGCPENVAPHAAVFYVGAADLLAEEKLETIASNYEDMISKARNLAPETQIILISILPTESAKLNRSRIEPFNVELKNFAAKTANVEFLDAYSELSYQSLGQPEFFLGNYLSGKGYIRLAELLKQKL